MTFAFGNKSINQLNTVKPQLATLAKKVLERSDIDFTIIQGLRTIEESKANKAKGTSFLADPNKSKHLTGDAIDFAPYINGTINWKDLEAFWYIAQLFKKVAEEEGIKIRLGADWNNSGDYHDEIQRGTLDAGHVELI